MIKFNFLINKNLGIWITIFNSFRTPKNKEEEKDKRLSNPTVYI